MDIFDILIIIFTMKAFVPFLLLRWQTLKQEWLRLCTHVSVRRYQSSDGQFASSDVLPQFFSRSIRFFNIFQCKFASECDFFRSPTEKINRRCQSAIRWHKSQSDACEHSNRNQWNPKITFTNLTCSLTCVHSLSFRPNTKLCHIALNLETKV